MMLPTFDGRALPLANWPERDRRAWTEAQTENDDLLDIHGPAARWRSSSRELHRRCYGIWLSWLASENLLVADEPPAQRVTKARLAAYLRAQRALGKGARTLVNHAVGLRHMFEALAPGQDWRWMLPMIGKLKTAVKPQKNHTDLPSIRELFELGLLLMRYAEEGRAGTIKERAILFRNGLSIAMLAARPLMRRNNLALIRIGVNLIEDGPVYRLRFSRDEMKGRAARGGPLPRLLTSAVNRYIGHHRPTLLGSRPEPDETLFISSLGRPIYPHAMSHEIGKVTEAIFGRRITTHEFRHAAGSSIAKEDPSYVGIVPSVLGHSNFRTSESYYIFADEHAAFRSLDRALETLTRNEDNRKREESN